MKKFDSFMDALRYIKEELPNEDELHLMAYDGEEPYYVSAYESDLSEIMESDFYDWGFECDPDRFAEDYTIWKYCPKDYKEKWNRLFKDYKPTLFSKDHIRGKCNAYGETIVSFSVSYY